MSVGAGPLTLAAGQEITLNPPAGSYAAVGLINVSPMPLLLFAGEDWLGPWQADVFPTLSTNAPVIVDPTAASGAGLLLVTWYTPDEAGRRR